MTYDPGSGYPYAPQPIPPKKSNVGTIIGIGCGGVLALALLGGCVAALSSPSDDGEKASTSESSQLPATVSGTTAGLDSSTVTELSIGIAWEQYSDADKDLMCTGIDAFGTDWAAREMRKGGSTDSGIDWDYAAQLVEEKCAARVS